MTMRLWIAMLVACCAFGCGGGADTKLDAKKRPTFPVSGTVTYKGMPVAEAVVTFRSTGMGATVAAAGTTDSSGNFTLTTYKGGDGAVEGKHVVSVIKTVVEGFDPSYSDVNSPNYGKPAPKTTTKYLVPEKYSSFDKSGLTADVPKGGASDVKLELKD